MFERVAPTSEQLDAEAREGRSENQIAALRLAAVLILVDALLTLLVGAAFGALFRSGVFIAIPIRLGLAYYLYKLRPRAEALALGLTILGAIVTLLGAGLRFSVQGILGAIPPLGACGALLLLLLGDPPREKRMAAIVVYAVLVVLPAVLLIVLRLAGVLAPPAAGVEV